MSRFDYTGLMPITTKRNAQHLARRSRTYGLAAGVVAGAAIGAALGLLFAPKSGKETREDIKNKGAEVIGEVKEKSTVIIEKIKDKFSKNDHDENYCDTADTYAENITKA